MNTKLTTIRLIGLKLPYKTSNKCKQAMADCGNLWRKFEEERYFDKIPDKIEDSIYAVYYAYEGDYTQPYSYFLGCKVEDSTELPDSLDELVIPNCNYSKFTTRGILPDCVAHFWRSVWINDYQYNRSYEYDFEVYDKRSQDWENAEVDIYLSVKSF